MDEKSKKCEWVPFFAFVFAFVGTFVVVAGIIQLIGGSDLLAGMFGAIIGVRVADQI